LSIIRNHILRSNGIVLSWLTPIGADRPTSSTTTIVQSAASRLGEATKRTDENRTIEPLQQPEGSHGRIHELTKAWITKACEKAISRTSINGWREITWWTSDLAKMKKQTNLWRRRLNKTLDLETRERAQNAFQNCLQRYKAAIRTAKENT